jgi:Zn-dependent M28 family amino/carboxypeptidase
MTGLLTIAMAIPLITTLQTHIESLARNIRGRVAGSGLDRAASYISDELRSSGYTPKRQTFEASGHTYANIEAEIKGSASPERIIIVGAHYDTAGNLPGANDNASGVAATLELARQFANKNPRRTIRWVFFANEEPPFFQTPAMGGYVYAKRCHDRNEPIEAMLSLETIGYYTDAPGSQQYPVGFHPGYPDTGNFLGFVADLKSTFLLRSALKAFRHATALAAEGVLAPSSIPGIGWSDHWSFWKFGYKALMLTDTAPFRYQYYHSAQDTPDKLDYVRSVMLSRAFQGVIAHVAE